MSRTAAYVRQTVVPSSPLLPDTHVGFSIAIKQSYSRGVFQQNRPKPAGHRFQKQTYCAACVRQRRILLGEGIAKPMATVFATTASDVHDRTAGTLACMTERLPLYPTDPQGA